MDPLKFTTPVGRLIWGSVHERQKTDYYGKPYESGKEPIQFGVAFRKDDPAIGQILQQLYQYAISGYPNNALMHERINREWQNGLSGRDFAFKVRDGNAPNRKGVVNPNAKDCWVFNFSTTLPVKCAHWDVVPGVPNTQEIDPKLIKTGYYVDVFGTASFGDSPRIDDTAGLFMNPGIVRLRAYGQEITGGPSIEEAFGTAAPASALPPGASLTPPASVATPPMGAPAVPPAPASAPAPGVAPAPAPATVGAPSMPGMTAAPTSAPAAPPYPGFTALPPG